MATTYISTISQYALLLGIGAVAVHTYKPELLRNILPAGPAAQPSSNQDTSVATHKKKGKKTKPSQEEMLTEKAENEPSSNKGKKKKTSAPVDQPVSAAKADGARQGLLRTTEASTDNSEFAKEMAKARSGTNLQTNSVQKPATITPAAPALQPQPKEPIIAPSSSSRDGDDDTSSIESPVQYVSSGKNVSDMLEATAAGPNSIRLTNVSTDSKKQKQKPKEFEQVLSKKKRNEQARREEQRRINQESDRLHEQKKQEHLRAARIAEGTSKQQKASSFASTSQNAWQAKPKANNTTRDSSTTAMPLLDTFEQSAIGSDAASLKANGRDSTPKPVQVSSQENSSFRDQLTMPEEEQIARVHEQEQESAWESVQSKKSKKKTKKENDTSSEASLPNSDVQQPVNAPAPVQKPKTNGSSTSTSQPVINRYEAIIIESNGLSNDEWTA